MKAAFKSTRGCDGIGIGRIAYETLFVEGMSKEQQPKTLQHITKLVLMMQDMLIFFNGKLVDVCVAFSFAATAVGFEQEYHEKIKKVLGRRILETKYEVDVLGQSGEENIGEYHKKIAEYKRTDIMYQSCRYDNNELLVEHTDLFDDEIIVLFQDTYKLKTCEDDCMETQSLLNAIHKLENPSKAVSSSPKMEHTSQDSTVDSIDSRMKKMCKDEFCIDANDVQVLKTVAITPLLLTKATMEFKHDVHLIVLVSGYQGSSYDLAFMKNILAFQSSDIEGLYFVSSMVNDDDSSCCIDQLGLNLSLEVKSMIENAEITSNVVK